MDKELYIELKIEIDKLPALLNAISIVMNNKKLLLANDTQSEELYECDHCVDYLDELYSLLQESYAHLLSHQGESL